MTDEHVPGEFEEEERRYEEAGVVNRRHLSDAVLQVAIRQLPHADPVVLPETATVGEAIGQMQERRHGGVVVVDARRRVRGVFTERDVLYRIAGQSVDLATARLSDYMTADPVVLRPTDPIGLALNKMAVGGYRHIPLVDGANEPVGVISMRDIALFIAEFFPESALNVPPDASTVADEPAGG
jgi:CBS domain-containing protein